MTKFSRLMLTAALLGTAALPAFAQGTATHGTAATGGVPHQARRHDAGPVAATGAGAASTAAPAVPPGGRSVTPAPSGETGKPATPAAGTSGTGVSGTGMSGTGGATTGTVAPAVKAPSVATGHAPAPAGGARAN